MNKPLYKSKQKKYLVRGFILVLIVVAVTIMVLNRQWISDWYFGLRYAPSVEMAVIRDKLDLTDRGEFLFNATRPVLNEAEEFNQNCRKDESDEAILGCYMSGNIYVYDITEKELSGIRELTAAHELLHAVWERMGENERQEFAQVLNQVLTENQDLLSEEINLYDVSEKQEELYVRAGTEIKKLPEVLEKHFAEIFKDQDKIVDFYESYITVFREIKAKMEILLKEITDLGVEIDDSTIEYKMVAEQLEEDITSFNSCAETVGCFRNNNEFYVARNRLLNRQRNLREENQRINELVETYNAKVDEYNNNATRGRKLQNMINSTYVPEMK